MPSSATGNPGNHNPSLFEIHHGRLYRHSMNNYRLYTGNDLEALLELTEWSIEKSPNRL